MSITDSKPRESRQSVSRPDGSRLEYTRDLDGRVLTQRLLDVGDALHSRSQTLYDARCGRPRRGGGTRRARALAPPSRPGTKRGQLLYECAESVAGGCTRQSHGALPATGSSATFWYSPGGQLKKSQDAEGATTEYFRDARKWVTRTASRAANEPTRGTFFTYDDDGQTLTTVYGDEVTGLLSESRSWDGLSRLSTLTDTQGRHFKVGSSRRELTARVDLVQSLPSGPVLWRSTWLFDGFGRAALQRSPEVTHLCSREVDQSEITIPNAIPDQVARISTPFPSMPTLWVS